MSQYHNVEKVAVEQGVLSLVVDGKRIRHDLHGLSPVLAQASGEEAAVFEVSPSGYGIHWPLLDEDISIDGLLGVEHGPSQSQKVV